MELRKEIEMLKPSIDVPEELQDYLEVENCSDFNMERFFLTDKQKEIADAIMRRKRLVNEMHKLGLQCLNAVMLYGPPGTGKTTFGRYMAHLTNMDFAYINFAELMDGVLGNTARNLKKIFTFMQDAKCIFMLDEIDTIALERGTEEAATGGELGRITAALMQNLDKMKAIKSNTIIIGGTNRIDRLDSALKSRFPIIKEFPKLTNSEKEQLIIRYMNNIGISYDLRNIKEYCARNNSVTPRNIEMDIIKGVEEWIENGKKDFRIVRIRDEEREMGWPAS